MSFRPLHDHILIKRVEEHEAARGGIIIPDTAKEKSQEGMVVAVGAGRVLDNGGVFPVGVEIGDRILFGKYAGAEVRIASEDYVILREDDIAGVLIQTGTTAGKK